MNTLRSLLAVPALAVLTATAAHAQGPCVDHGWCHFTPLNPEVVAQESHFGWSVDIHGDRAVIGAPNLGVVSVYERVDGVWQIVQLLEDPHAGNNRFGAKVALSHDFIAVGAHLDDTAGANAGAVHVFVLQSGLWVLDETLTSTAPAVEGRFGFAVDVDGIWLAVGAPGDGGTGRVHVFMRTFAWWLLLTKVGSASGDTLGWSVAVDQIEGDTAARVVAGDPYCDVAGNNAGRISTLYVRPFSYYHELVTSPVPQAGANFGWDVDIQDSTIVASSRSASTGGIASGAVDVFDVDLVQLDPSFDHVQRLTPCSDASSPLDALASFGQSLVLDGDRLAVGVPGRNEGSTLGGSVEVYRPNLFGAGFTRDGHVFAQGADSADVFGWDVALDGDTLIVGALGDAFGGAEAGAVYPVSLASKTVVGGACPCDCLSNVTYYGTGKPGTNGVPTIGTLSSPVPGESIVLGVSNAFVGASPILVWGLTPAAVPFDGGVILVEDLHLEFLPTIGPLGQVGIGWDVPSDPATCGLDVFVQAFMFDPGASGVFALAHTNGMKLTVGY